MNDQLTLLGSALFVLGSMFGFSGDYETGFALCWGAGCALALSHVNTEKS